MLEAIRLIAITLISFVTALVATPFVFRMLVKFNFRKQIRTSKETPIFSKLHQGKAGTPNSGGIIIWGTVILMAGLFWLLDVLFDGFFGYLNFVDRAQTYLPLIALLIAALIGLFDDVLNALKIGPK